MKKGIIIIYSFIIPILFSLMFGIPDLFYDSDSYFYFNNVLKNNDSGSLGMDLITNIINLLPTKLSIETTALICKLSMSFIFGLSGVILGLTLYKLNNKKRGLFYTLILLYSISPIILQRLNFNLFDTDPLILLFYNSMLYLFLNKKSLLALLVYYPFIKTWGYANLIFTVLIGYEIIKLLIFCYNNIKDEKFSNIRDWGLMQKFSFIAFWTFIIGSVFIVQGVINKILNVTNKTMFNNVAELQPNIFQIFAYIFIVIFIGYRLVASIIKKQYLNNTEYYLSYLCIGFFIGSLFASRLNLFFITPFIIYLYLLDRKVIELYQQDELFITGIVIMIIVYLAHFLILFNTGFYYVPDKINSEMLDDINTDYLVVPWHFGYYSEIYLDNNTQVLMDGGNYTDLETACFGYNKMCDTDKDYIYTDLENKTYYITKINKNLTEHKVLCDLCQN